MRYNAPLSQAEIKSYITIFVAHGKYIIKNNKTKNIINPTLLLSGYYIIVVNCGKDKPKTYSLHRALYAYFKGDIPAGYVVDHIDSNRSNNDLSNLQLLSSRQNVLKGKVSKTVHKLYKPRKYKSQEYYENKFILFYKQYEYYKEIGNAQKCHSLRASICNYRNILKEIFNIDIDEKLGM